MRILGRLILAAIGLLLAIPVAALVLGIGAMAEPSLREAIGSAGLRVLFSLADAALDGVPPDGAVLGLASGLWSLSMALIVGPPALTALIGEVLGLRSLVFYGGLSGAFAAAVPWLVRTTPARPEYLALDGALGALLFLTGALSGLTYWAVAGRSAGSAPREAPA